MPGHIWKYFVQGERQVVFGFRGEWSDAYNTAPNAITFSSSRDVILENQCGSLGHDTPTFVQASR